MSKKAITIVSVVVVIIVIVIGIGISIAKADVTTVPVFVPGENAVAQLVGGTNSVVTEKVVTGKVVTEDVVTEDVVTKDVVTEEVAYDAVAASVEATVKAGLCAELVDRPHVLRVTLGVQVVTEKNPQFV